MLVVNQLPCLIMKEMRVLKFGGTSVGTVESITAVINIVTDYHQQGIKQVVASSALSGVTNKLIDMGKKAANSDDTYQETLRDIENRHYDIVKALIDVKSQSKIFANLKIVFNELEDLLHGIFLIKELSVRTLDLVMSFGERLSSYIIAETLRVKGIETDFVDARTFIKTDNNFGNARVNFELTNKLIKTHFAKTENRIQLVTGFIASTEKDETTTLGRGGSDYTAAIIGAALNAAVIEIWTDVDGILTSDPRVVKNAFTLPTVSYIEAMEMSHFGAKVIYPPTVQPAFAKNIPIRIKNTFNPSFEGTLISNKAESGNFIIKGIASIGDTALLNVQGGGMVGITGISGRLFSALARQQVNVILITQASSEFSISLAVDPQEAERAKAVIEEEFEHEIRGNKIEPVAIETGLSVVAVIGENMKENSGISAKLFGALGMNGVNVKAIAQGSSEYNISVVVKRTDLSKSLNALHEVFFLSDVKSLNLYVVGLGLIGKTLIKQIQNQAAYLAKKHSLKINLVGVANSRKMLLCNNNIAIENWEAEFEAKAKPSNLSEFIKTIKEFNLPNCVFVDNTSSKSVVEHYNDLLTASVSIVTPNKLANSGTYAEYKLLRKSAKKHGVKFLYETNVGAGLPVINTLDDLLTSGDEIIRIEAILSGTLSYIFNSFKEGVRFVDIVKQAKEKGFTEPDPRDDLSGSDVARKILILARDSGLALEPADIEVENILPKSCNEAKSVPDFFQELENENAFFEKRRKDAELDGKVLRFIATLENGKASVTLRAVDAQHPFYSLSGSDNIISFTTERYKERPLVIKGPGAGAEVTAAGVFADIVKVFHYLV